MTLKVLSLGAGVQSTTMALMAAHGEFDEMPDVAIFADTGAEPRAVYEHLDWLRGPNVLPFPVEVVSAGNLRDDIMATVNGEQNVAGRTAGFLGAPFYTTAPTARGEGQLRRQCTEQYKVKPIRAAVREYLGIAHGREAKGKAVAETWLGISADEWGRANAASVAWLRTRWPFLSRVTEKDRRPWSKFHPDGLWFSRQDCLAWLEAHGYPRPPKSACTFCPYRSNEAWRRMKADDPESFADAVAVDEAIRDPGGHAGIEERLFVHRSITPLVTADLGGDDRQFDMLGECEGMCGV